MNPDPLLQNHGGSPLDWFQREPLGAVLEFQFRPRTEVEALADRFRQNDSTCFVDLDSHTMNNAICH